VRQGIVHIVGPEQGWTLPGMTVVCGDSHTATHGAFGALAHGIGTSEVEHVLATQTLIQKKSKNMKVEITGQLAPGVTAKDITLSVIGKTGTAGGTGYVIEYCGEAIRSLSMEGRMTVCNMAIEGGARAGLIAPDETTFEYVKGRPHAPKGAQWEAALAWWKTLQSDDDAHWDKVVTIRGEDIAPVVTWGTSPEDVLPITGVVPAPEDFEGGKVSAAKRSLDYMGLKPGNAAEPDRDRHGLHRLLHQRKDRGSARRRRDPEGQEDQGRPAGHGRARLRPRPRAGGGGGAGRHLQGGRVRMAACGLFHVPCDEPRPAGPEERCAATSNRNFEGRQGRGGRTHLMSPAMAAAAAVTGRLTDVRELM
jgi:3-isopropylmalate/(R)-2-methylmalate dehydratase large subunit